MNDNVKFDYDYVKDLLVHGIVTVRFTKADGSERIMKCTLRKDILPQPDYLTNLQAHDTERLAVWDIENEGWRSFRLDSIKAVTIAPIVAAV